MSKAVISYSLCNQIYWYYGQTHALKIMRVSEKNVPYITMGWKKDIRKKRKYADVDETVARRTGR